MVNDFLTRGKRIVFSQQTSILSAATTIMMMLILSSLLGLVRNRVWATYFTPNDLSLVFAAFRLPDFVFGTLAFGAFSSAFIPVFSRALRRDQQEAWRTASYVVSLGLTGFFIVALLFALLAQPFYRLILPGYSVSDTLLISSMARILFLSQGLFIVSYVLTGVLESLQRFFVPALAPLLYNLGIIIGTILFYPMVGIYAPVWGMVTGALLHFAIQFPLAHKLGFRFRFPPHVTDDVRKIGKLTAPRLVDLGVAQVLETVQLSLISFLSKASYAFFILANNLQLYPVSFLGTSLAKAAMPVLTRLEDDHQEFRRVILSILSQMIFLILPIVTILIVLRVPVVRLAFGTDKYDWDATVQTGWILTVFVISVPMQAIVTLLNRGFFALHDTKTPVIISVSADIVTIILDFIFILVFHWPVSSVALAFSIGMIIQFCLLYSLLFRKLGFVPRLRDFSSAVTPLFASFAAGSVMYILIRFFDRSVWVKQLSFIGFSPTLRSLPFQSFVVDTRYTLNLVLLTCSVSSIGLFIYLSLCFLFRSEALFSFSKVIHGRIRHLLPGSRPQEPITPTGNDL